MSGRVLPGAEPQSRAGRGERARVGVLLLHGFTGNPVSLRPLADLLTERGFAIELPLLPGHGTQWRDLLPTRYADWRAAALSALGGLRARTERVVVVALSMGAAIALDLASSAEPLAGVVTINVQILDREGLVVKVAPLLEKLVPVAPAAAAGLAKNDIKQGGDEQAYAWVGAAAGNSFVRELPKIRARLKQLTCPLLVVYSRDDHSVPPANSKALPSLVGSSDVELLELQSSYHVATLDNDLPLIADRVTAFADRVTASPKE